MPGADAPAAARGCERARALVTTSTPENDRHSPRDGFYGFLRALPGDRALLPPSPAFTGLTPASGRQDHTTSPSASGAFVFGTIRAHRIPPRNRDDRVSPLQWGGMADGIG